MTTVFFLLKSHQNMLYISFPSKLRQKNTPKQRWFFVQRNQVDKSASKRRWYFPHRSYAEQSTLKQRQFLAHRNYIEKLRQNDEVIGNLSIFSFQHFDVISTSHRHWFDVVCRCVITLTKGWLRWLTNLSFTDSRREKWLAKICHLDSDKFN